MLTGFEEDFRDARITIQTEYKLFGGHCLSIDFKLKTSILICWFSDGDVIILNDTGTRFASDALKEKVINFLSKYGLAIDRIL